MIDRVVLLFDRSIEEAIERMAVEHGLAVGSDDDLRAIISETTCPESRHRVLASAHRNVTALLTALGDIPKPLRPYVIAVTRAPHDLSFLPAGAIDASVADASDPALLQRVFKPARRILELQAFYREHALHDPLTGVFDRRAVFDLLGRELSRAARHGYPVAVAMIDLDLFADANTTLGHPGGDAAMVALVTRITSQLRPYDILGRYGGDEFLLVLSDCGLQQARVICERIRASISATPVQAGEKVCSLTISIGLTCALPRSGTSACEVVRLADRGLYAAKRAGRNTVVVEA